MYKITSEQLKEMFESPACRNTYVAGSGRCGLGKFIDACLGGGAASSIGHYAGLAGILKMPTSINDFFLEFRAMPRTIQQYAEINDSPVGSLQDNHRKALRLILQDALAVGFIELEDEVAKEFYSNKCMSEAV